MLAEFFASVRDGVFSSIVGLTLTAIAGAALWFRKRCVKTARSAFRRLRNLDRIEAQATEISRLQMIEAAYNATPKRDCPKCKMPDAMRLESKRIIDFGDESVTGFWICSNCAEGKRQKLV